MDIADSIEMRYLRSFIALGEELNFRRAAERMHVTTSALSMQIKKLEGLVGVRLCERDASRVQLTEAGEFLLGRAREVTQHMRSAITETMQVARKGHLSLFMGCPGCGNHLLVAEIINSYRKKFPETGVTIVDIAPAQEQINAVQEERLHVGFVCNARMKPIKGIQYQLVFESPMYVIVGARHPLAVKKEVTLGEVARYPVLHEPSYCCPVLLQALFNEKRIKPRSFTSITGANAWLARLTIDENVSIIPQNQAMVPIAGFSYLPIADTKSSEYAIWKNTDQTPQLGSFVKHLRQVCAVGA